MTRHWVIPGYRVGRICTDHEIRECFGFDFSGAEWHLHGRPVAASIRLRRKPSGGGMLRCRVHESQGQARFAEATIPGTSPSIDVPLRANALDEIWMSAAESFGLDGVLESLDGADVDGRNLDVSLVLETAPGHDVALHQVA